MKRLTTRNNKGEAILKDNSRYNDYEIIKRLAEIEDILGENYNLQKLKMLYKKGSKNGNM